MEITANCNLECPMCFAVSGPGGTNLTFDECRACIDRLVEVEGQGPEHHPYVLVFLPSGTRPDADIIVKVVEDGWALRIIYKLPAYLFDVVHALKGQTDTTGAAYAGPESAKAMSYQDSVEKMHVF